MTGSSSGESSAPALEVMAGQFQDLVRSMVEGHRSLEIEPVLDYARTAIAGADHAAITVARRGREPETVAATGELPIRVDALQYTLGEGPCVAALTVNDQVHVADLALDGRYPRFAPRALELGVRSMLSTRLFLAEHDRAALSLYSHRPAAFEPDQLALAAIFASYASLVLVNRLSEDKITRLERALESNREIGVAMGILMAQRRWTQSEAFDRLVSASQNLNRRLRDIAAEVRLTSRLPRIRQR
ncbi:MAG: GAF and ANTAR domain-containing protein [Propionibacteriaceae bacterium]|nr:GAF and ANTAR domain-containing protein [Propionibacteriaceae bacterium]